MIGNGSETSVANLDRRERRSLGRDSAQLCTEVAEGVGFEPTIRF